MQVFHDDSSCIYSPVRTTPRSLVSLFLRFEWPNFQDDFWNLSAKLGDIEAAKSAAKQKDRDVKARTCLRANGKISSRDGLQDSVAPRILGMLAYVPE